MPYTEYAPDPDFEEYDEIRLAIERGEADPSELDEWIAYHSDPANFAHLQAPPKDTIQHLDAKWRANHSHMVFNELYEEPDALCHALHLAHGRPLCFAGLPGCGKNEAAQALALAVISGKDAFERFPIARKGRVLHLTYDMGRWGTAIRYRRLANGMGIKPEEVENNLVLCAYPEINLMSPEAIYEFTTAMRGFDLCLLDNARTAIPGVDENDSNFGERIAAFGQACENAKAVGMYLHHSTKNGKPGVEAVRGSSAITAASGAVFFIEATGKPDEPREVTHIRAHDVFPTILEPFILRHAIPRKGSVNYFDVGGNPDLGPIRLVAELPGDFGSKGTADESEFEKVSRAVLGAVNANPGSSMRVIRDMVPFRTETVTAAMDQLIAAGTLLETSGSRRARLLSLAPKVSEQVEK